MGRNQLLGICWSTQRNLSACIKVDGAKTWKTATDVRAVIYREADADLTWIREQFLKHIGSENIILLYSGLNFID